MRVLHVGWGFSPWRPGGLIFYAEDLMAAQVARGHEVSYFFSGRHYPSVQGPRLKRWRRDDVAMYEVINAPLVPGGERGTRDPERELSEPRMEAAFRRAVERLRPEVVHFQELYALPSSLVDVAHEAGIPTLMTLQDYFPLCATLRLVDAGGELCTRLRVGEDCVARNVAAPADASELVAQTLQFERRRLRRRVRVPERLDFSPLHSLLWAANRLAARAAPPVTTPEVPAEAPATNPSLAAAFQRRRDLNVERLGRVGRLVAQSPRVAEVYAARGVSTERMSTLRFTLAHVERLRPRALGRPPDPVAFGTLGGCASPTKGVDVVLGALRELRDAGLEGRFRLLVFGTVDERARPELESHAGVELRGGYWRADLDGLLDEIDVGIMPSVWDEAFGYTGVEMVAKGIPLLANPLGGIVEYALPGETAWLNESLSGAGLAEHMARLVREPGDVLEMHRRTLAARDRVITPFAGHVDAIEALYVELAAQSSSVP